MTDAPAAPLACDINAAGTPVMGMLSARLDADNGCPQSAGAHVGCHDVRVSPRFPSVHPLSPSGTTILPTHRRTTADQARRLEHVARRHGARSSQPAATQR